MKLSAFFGGRSYEHEVSIVSAIVLKDILTQIEHFIFVDRKGDTYQIPRNLMKASTFSSGDYQKCPKIQLTQGGFLEKKFLKDSFTPIEMALNVIHGAEGEDGTMASLFEFYSIPYIGPRIEASALSYNKLLTKLYAQSRNVPTLPYQILHKQDRQTATLMDLPFIAKPLRLGSSIGIATIHDTKELEYQLDVAFEFDDTLLIEPFVQNIAEYNLAGCYIPQKDTWHFSIIEEPQKGEILDFDKKYLDFSRSTTIEAANLSEETQAKIKELFKRIYTHCFEGALIRCDFFIKDNEVYLNEINPNPGSLAHYLFKDFNAVINMLAEHTPQKRMIPINYTFIHKIHHAKGK